MSGDALPVVPGVGDVYLDASSGHQYRRTAAGWEQLSAMGDGAWMVAQSVAFEQREAAASDAAANALTVCAERIREHGPELAAQARDVAAALALVAWMVDRMAEAEQVANPPVFR